MADTMRSTLNAQRSTLNAQRSTLNAQRSTLNAQRSTLNAQRSTMHIKTSIVIATYNGSKYISEQLDSIRTQTLAPDEVIITDDLSTDGTYELCMDYIKQHNLTGWHVFKNEKNLGPGGNFRRAIAISRGEYIFTCDQDDIWLPDKIRVMVSLMEERPEIKLLLSNYIAIKDGNKIRAHLKNIDRDDGSVLRYSLQDSWVNTLRPGCTFCFRSELADKFKVMDIESRLHDDMLYKYAVVSDSLYLLNRQLIYYRRHDGTATDPFGGSSIGVQRKIDDANKNIYLCKRLLEEADGLEITEYNKKLLNDYIKFLEKRIKMLEHRNLLATICFVMINFKYYPTARNALSDIYAMIFLK